MKKIKSSFIFILVQIFCSLCFGADVEKLDLAELSARIPRRLIQSGLTQLGDLKMEDLVAKLTDPSFVVFHLLEPQEKSEDTKGEGPGVGQLRYGGHCFDKTSASTTSIGKKLNVDGGLVLIDPQNIKRLNESEDRFEQLLLHEGLCALYGPQSDDHYQMSSLLIYLSIDNKTENPSDFRTKIFKSPTYLKPFFNYKSRSTPQSENLILLAGGVTGGAGGGDPTAAMMKPLLVGIFANLVNSCETSYKNTLPCIYLTGNHEGIWKALSEMQIETDNDEQTNCQVIQAQAQIPFNRLVDFQLKDGRTIKVLHIGQCQLAALLNTYSPTVVAINVMKLFWILCLYDSDFPKAVGFGLNDLGILNQL